MTVFLNLLDDAIFLRPDLQQHVRINFKVQFPFMLPTFIEQDEGQNRSPVHTINTHDQAISVSPYVL